MACGCCEHAGDDNVAITTPLSTNAIQEVSTAQVVSRFMPKAPKQPVRSTKRLAIQPFTTTEVSPNRTATKESPAWSWETFTSMDSRMLGMCGVPPAMSVAGGKDFRGTIPTIRRASSARCPVAKVFFSARGIVRCCAGTQSLLNSGPLRAADVPQRLLRRVGVQSGAANSRW